MAHFTTCFTAQFTSRHSYGCPNYCNGPRCNDRATLPCLSKARPPAAMAHTVRLLIFPRCETVRIRVIVNQLITELTS